MLFRSFTDPSCPTILWLTINDIVIMIKLLLGHTPCTTRDTFGVRSNGRCESKKDATHDTFVLLYTAKASIVSVCTTPSAVGRLPDETL